MAFSLINKVKQYGQYKVVANDPLCSDDIKNIEKAEIIDGKYGLSVCFTYISGNTCYLPVDKYIQNKVGVGDVLDPKEIRVLTLQKGMEETYAVTF